MKTAKPITTGNFSVRVNGAWTATLLQENEAWSAFLSECRVGHLVELLRGAIVVAYLGSRS
jgi:hypothetical protein